jgi:hypothetical protein
MQGSNSVLEQSICFEQSPAMIAFRRSAGDANRLLNTLLVGLETLEHSTPVKPGDLVVAWSKPNTGAEWLETRNFALRGTMVALVDALDRYLCIISRIEGLTAPELDDPLNGRKGPRDDRRPTLSERVAALCSHYSGAVHPAYVLAVTLLVAWRNQFAHFEHKGGLSRTERLQLLTHAVFFQTNFGGADIRRALERYDAREPPTLGDLSTLIAASQRLVKDIDEHLLHLQDARTYVVSLTRYILESSADPAAALEAAFFRGGNGAAGRVHAILLENGGNHSPNRRPSAPSLSRVNLNKLLGLSRNKAAALFGIRRPKTGPGG